MKKFIMALVAAIVLVLVPTVPASASGSDGPTPYTVATDGIYLPAGDVFTDGSHVNVKDDKGKTYNIHFESKYADPTHAEWRNLPFDHKDPRNQFYGQSFLPWEALKNFDAKTEFCVTWVQIHTNNGYNQHFGEGGQEPVGTGCEFPPDLIEPAAWTNMEFTCETQVGDVIDRTRQVKITKFKYDGSVKSVETVTESGTYTVVESDLWNIDCREVITPVVPTLKLATATCVAEEPVYTPAVLTLPAVENGVWSRDGEAVTGDITLDRDAVATFVFAVTDDELFKLGDVPVSDDTYWTAVADGNTIVFTVAPNVVDLNDCDLANSGLLMNPLVIAGAIILPLAGLAFVLMERRRKQTA